MFLENKLQGNLWKYFIFSLSQRRNFIPLLSIYFLTLPDTNAQQIGLYTAIGFLTSFLFEVPSGYFADKFGHKRTLVLSKILMIFSMLSFIFAESFGYFLFGSIFLSLSFSFGSGTNSAFMHETLVSLKREKDYTKIMSKISANVSFVSMILIIALPFLTKISILLPFKITFIFDLIGLVVALLLVSPARKENIIKNDITSLFQRIKNLTFPGFYLVSVFIGITGGCIIGTSAFRSIYLQSIGYPIIFIGFVMGLSRFFWFLFGNKIHLLEEKLGVKKILKFEIILFPLLFILVVSFSNPYFVGFLFSLMVGYFWSRNHIIINYFITNFIKDKNYKATMLSIKNQVSLIIQVSVSFLIGFIMKESYLIGYLTTGIILFFSLLILYPRVKKYLI